MINGLRFHHFGIACRDLHSETEVYASIGYTAESTDWIDPTQGVKGRFLVGGGPRLELLEALPDSEVLDPWLQSGSRIYQQAFETDDLDGHIAEFQKLRAHVVLAPVPAVAFDGRRISFLMLRNMTLIELIESP